MWPQEDQKTDSGIKRSINIGDHSRESWGWEMHGCRQEYIIQSAPWNPLWVQEIVKLSHRRILHREGWGRAIAVRRQGEAPWCLVWYHDGHKNHTVPCSFHHPRSKFTLVSSIFLTCIYLLCIYLGSACVLWLRPVRLCVGGVGVSVCGVSVCMVCVSVYGLCLWVVQLTCQLSITSNFTLFIYDTEDIIVTENSN